MNVESLIKQLQQLPQEAEVGYCWDSACRSGVDVVFLAKSGMVLLSSEYEIRFLSDDDEPAILSTSQDKD